MRRTGPATGQHFHGPPSHTRLQRRLHFLSLPFSLHWASDVWLPLPRMSFPIPFAWQTFAGCQDSRQMSGFPDTTPAQALRPPVWVSPLSSRDPVISMYHPALCHLPPPPVRETVENRSCLVSFVPLAGGDSMHTWTHNCGLVFYWGHEENKQHRRRDPALGSVVRGGTGE